MLVIKQFGPVTYAMGTLQEILAGTGIAAKVRALPNDVAGCTLEMGADGLWTGASVGTLTQVQADALVASGALATVKVGTPGTVAGYAVVWRDVAWVDQRLSQNKIFPASVSRRLGTNATAKSLARTALDTRARLIIPEGPGFVKFVFRNGGIDGSQVVETTLLSAIGTIEINATMFDGFNDLWCKLTFNGSEKISIAPGCVVISDPIAYTYKNNGLVYIKTHATVSGGYIPAMQIEGVDGISTAGVDLTGDNSSAGYTTGSGYGFLPLCVVSDSCNQTVFAVGDSITDGVGDDGLYLQYNNYKLTGWISRACSAIGAGAVVRGFPGGISSQFDFLYDPILGKELSIIGANRYIFAFGANDCMFNSVATIKAAFIRGIKKLIGMGAGEIICPLILPRTTSTDGWITETNQTPIAGFELGGTRDQINQWLISGADGYVSKTIDTLTGVANGTVWKARMTKDGAHPYGSGSDVNATGNACAIIAKSAESVLA